MSDRYLDSLQRKKERKLNKMADRFLANAAKREKKKKARRAKNKQCLNIKTEEDITSKRYSKWYNAWRRLVIKKNGRKCNRCGKTEGEMHVHHIKSYHYHKKERLKLDNGEVLCFDCHDKAHGGYLSRKRKKRA